MITFFLKLLWTTQCSIIFLWEQTATSDYCFDLTLLLFFPLFSSSFVFIFNLFSTFYWFLLNFDCTKPILLYCFLDKNIIHYFIVYIYCVFNCCFYHNKCMCQGNFWKLMYISYFLFPCSNQFWFSFHYSNEKPVKRKIKLASLAKGWVFCRTKE